MCDLLFVPKHCHAEQNSKYMFFSLQMENNSRIFISSSTFTLGIAHYASTNPRIINRLPDSEAWHTVVRY